MSKRGAKQSGRFKAPPAFAFRAGHRTGVAIVVSFTSRLQVRCQGLACCSIKTLHVGVFGADRVVLEPDRVADSIEELPGPFAHFFFSTVRWYERVLTEC